MIRAAGIDLGGSKSEVQLFDDNWSLAARRRDPTPASYDALLDLLTDQIAWAAAEAGAPVPIGIGAAGLVRPDGRVLALNLPADGRPLPADICRAAGRPVTYLNDARALALSEAVLGPGRPHTAVAALILGTGVGGGIVLNGRLPVGASGTLCEFGLLPAPVHLIGAHGLTLWDGGLGRIGTYEDYISGPGLARMAQELTGQTLSPEEIGSAKDVPGPAQDVWSLWLALTAELVLTLVRVADPGLVVLGGGLSRVPGVADDLAEALQAAQLPGFAVPAVALAEGGDASGARGAALAAWQDAEENAGGEVDHG